MYISAINATMTTAATATMATVDAARITRASYPAICPQKPAAKMAGLCEHSPAVRLDRRYGV
jgi:hypothetical protein